MACKLIWSPEALNDLRDIVRYIAIDNPEKAGSFGIALIGKVELLANFPEMGRVVPEHRNPSIREIIVRPYRIIYRLRDESGLIEILRVWHGARGEPQDV